MQAIFQDPLLHIHMKMHSTLAAFAPSFKFGVYYHNSRWYYGPYYQEYVGAPIVPGETHPAALPVNWEEKLVWDEYNGVAQNVDDFITRFMTVNFNGVYHKVEELTFSGDNWVPVVPDHLKDVFASFTQEYRPRFSGIFGAPKVSYRSSGEAPVFNSHASSGHSYTSRVGHTTNNNNILFGNYRFGFYYTGSGWYYGPYYQPGLVGFVISGNAYPQRVTP